MAREGIPTEAQFKQATSPPKTAVPVKWLLTGRGSEMVLIDSALAEWDAGHSGPQHVQVKALRHITGACATYLKSRIDKSSSLATRRKGEVRKVLDLALAALKKLDVAEGTFASHKTKAVMHGKFEGKTTSLSGGYQHERTSYVKSGKTAAVAASALHGDIDNFSTSSYKTYMKSYGEALQQEMVNNKAKAQSNLQVAYLTKGDRMAYLAIPQGGVFRRPDGTALVSTDVNWGKRVGEVWSMDRYGNMFVKNPLSIPNKGRYFNHSSFNAGNDVICAGVCLFNPGGRLVYVDNGSGHYKPDSEAMRTALAFLAEEGVDLREMRVGLLNPVTGEPVSYQALTVLRTPNINPATLPSDWDDAFDAALNLPHGPIMA